MPKACPYVMMQFSSIVIGFTSGNFPLGEYKKIALCGGEPRERFAMLGFIVFYAIGD